MLAKLLRGGELTSVWVPDAAHEAMRDLIRARATAMRVLGKAQQHLRGFLLRHGRIYSGKKGWTVAYRRWLTTVYFQHPAQQILFQAMSMPLLMPRRGSSAWPCRSTPALGLGAEGPVWHGADPALYVANPANALRIRTRLEAA